MKQQLLILILVAGVTFGVSAQTQPASKTFTLQQCIDYALENSVQTQNASIDEAIAQARVRETVGIGLPQISGSASITDNPQLPRFFQTKQVATMFSGAAPTDPDPLPGVGTSDVVSGRNFFQLPSSGDVSVSINQIIFNGSYLVGLKASKAYKDLAYKSTLQTKEQIIQQVTKAYYAVLINKERAELFDSNIGRVDSLLRNTKAMNENGFAESIDVDRIRVSLNNLITQRDNFLNMSILSVELLKFQMNYPMNESVTILGDITEVEIDPLITYEDNWSYKDRPDYKVLEANKKLQQLNIKNQYATALPNLSAFLNAGYMTQSTNIGGLFQTKTNLSQVPAATIEAGGYGVDKWYNYSMFGFKLAMPIFTGLQNTYKIQQQKLELTKINNNFRALESSIDLEVKQTTLNFENALKTLQSQKENMELAGNVARVTKIKYEQGVGSNIEVIDAEDSLRQSQTNYYNALFDAMVAKIDLDKAYGKLLPQTETK